MMGQSTSVQREDFLRRDQERLSQLRIQRTVEQDIRLAEAETAAREAILSLERRLVSEFNEAHPSFSRDRITPEFNVVVADFMARRQLLISEILAQHGLSERPYTPFETNDLFPDGSRPNLPHSRSVSSGISNMLRRGRRRISQRFATNREDGATAFEDPQPRHRLLSNRFSMLVGGQGMPRPSRRRFSALFSGSTEGTGVLRRRRNISAVSGPLPLEPDPWWDPPWSTGDSSRFGELDHPSDETTPEVTRDTSVRRRSRLSRVRDSLLPPVPNFLHFHNRPSRPSNEVDMSSSQPAPGAAAELEDYLPRIHTSPIGMDITQPTTSSADRESQAQPGLERFGLNLGSSGPPTDRTTRRPSNVTRQDSSRQPVAEDQAARLSRHLSVAATAIAASLVGNTERAFSEAHDVTSDGVEGSFDSFLQALQNGSLAMALRNGGSEANGNSDAPSGGSTFTPVNFFRIFRFGSNSDQEGRSVGLATTTEPEQESSTRELSSEHAGRMVPVIIVGIRSVTPREGEPQEEGNTTSPLFDALSNLPLIMPPGITTRGSGTLLRRTDRRSRFSRNRRASMSAVNGFPANYDRQRHQRMSSAPGRQPLEELTAVNGTVPTALSETPPGPHPPPSTPAEHALSAAPSAPSTPLRRPSSASGAQSPSSNPASRGPLVTPDRPIQEPVMPRLPTRRRRLSDSEFARYRDFGPGSTRRHGIVGDSEVDPSTTPFAGSQPEGTRTWIVYVLGGSYPEDHPILTTPSLFTDVSRVVFISNAMR